MARTFAKIAFTPNVQKLQTLNGSRSQYLHGTEEGALEDVTIGAYERQFIEHQDHFYQATVSENGWPYVQHKGGPPGFLKVLDEHTIGYADFKGNRQYISDGNLTGDDRVHLILVDYALRQRLKIWGHARIVNEAEAPELLAKLELPHYRARVERAIVIQVEAFDWNCPQHITPRMTEAEWLEMSAH